MLSCQLPNGNISQTVHRVGWQWRDIFLPVFYPSHHSSYNRSLELCAFNVNQVSDSVSSRYSSELRPVSLCSAGPGLYHPEVRVFGPLPASRVALDKVWHSIELICSASLAKCWQSPFPSSQRVLTHCPSQSLFHASPLFTSSDPSLHHVTSSHQCCGCFLTPGCAV